MSSEPVWFKSSHSGGEGGDCVEVWFKSSHSGGEGGNCVEVAETTESVLVRDSKDKSGPRLAFSPTAWRSFVEFAQSV
ncbi:DUF397 domain-containing protein [Streptomyces sp. NRRL S-495]|uniref:DUF397 domain-containing protein n=1 Tax=Streptomyces sp. NRRL S-495 TaxID=1609133 RepID=UPI0005F8FC88|nr:DUF397 domain-containing protein [Streptomyces sp. NRRL S-495]KJY35558.1 toxin [Streptomyces sp. NRRL S-495]